MSTDMMTSILFPVAATVVWLLVASLGNGKRRRVSDRLQRLSDDNDSVPAAPGFTQFARTTLPKMGAVVAPTNDKERSVLRARLVHAGLYHSQALYFFLGIKLLLTLVPLIAMVVLFVMLPQQRIVVLGGGSVVAILGMIVPSFWLDGRTKRRQVAFRRALPDALDLMVICLEGGLSLPASLKRIADVLGSVHPMLAVELKIADRGIQMGMTPGEGLSEFADRADLEEVRSLAAVVGEAERLGGSMARTLRAHAESLRERRTQRAEEMAHKAGVKVLFPTVALIFPAIFVVILGPAAIQIFRTLL